MAERTEFVPATAPTEFELLLGELRRRQWAQHVWGPSAAPFLLGHIHHCGGCADVNLIHAEDDASAWRAPLLPSADPWHPEVVWWQYHSPAVWALRAVLGLPQPGTHGAPQDPQAPNRRCRLPVGLQSPMTVRPLGVR